MQKLLSITNVKRHASSSPTQRKNMRSTPVVTDSKIEPGARPEPTSFGPRQLDVGSPTGTPAGECEDPYSPPGVVIYGSLATPQVSNTVCQEQCS
ncbi:unnamed protein product [Pieris macdunnoughi]|uniref:Uncharacterized protein n=1 Tax=Pieris macdunnoughi TaxID=345717 RepID=A0A821XVQ5_9NEOP|nr:unnamed protein product [Pieris macdunnoughi]